MVLVFLTVGSPGCFRCLLGRIHLVGPLELLVQLLAGGCCLAAVNSGLLLQTGGLGRLHVRFGLSGAGLGGGLVGQRLALLNLQCFVLGGLADLAGFHVAVLVAFVARQPRKRGDEQKCRDRDDDDQNDTAGSHIGSLDWLSMVGFTSVGIELWALRTGLRHI